MPDLDKPKKRSTLRLFTCKHCDTIQHDPWSVGMNYHCVPCDKYTNTWDVAVDANGPYVIPNDIISECVSIYR